MVAADRANALSAPKPVSKTVIQHRSQKVGCQLQGGADCQRSKTQFCAFAAPGFSWNFVHSHPRGAGINSNEAPTEKSPHRQMPPPDRPSSAIWSISTHWKEALSWLSLDIALCGIARIQTRLAFCCGAGLRCVTRQDSIAIPVGAILIIPPRMTTIPGLGMVIGPPVRWIAV